MKRNIFIMIIVLGGTFLVHAQTPHAFKYQAVVRNDNGQIVTSQNIMVQITILQSNIMSEPIYIENHDDTTNNFGLINLTIGQGEIQQGNFTSINWGNGPYFLKTAIDLSGGLNFQELGITQLLSVPFSMFSENGIHVMSFEEREALENPQEGMQIYNTTTNCLNYFNGSNWFETCGDCSPMPSVADAGNDTAVEGGATNILLSANIPQNGLGQWSVINGTGGDFENPTDPTTSFTGSQETSYTLRWTITSVCDSSYDEVNISFYTWCGIPFTDPRDAQSYETIQIGDQCWMAENLNVGTMIAGSHYQVDNGVIEKYCYNNDQANCDNLGGLYQLHESVQYNPTQGQQGICPPGWHLPTDLEWKILEGTVDSQYGIGDPEWDGIEFRGSDAGTNLRLGGSSGFDAISTGYRLSNGNFGFSYVTYFWTSTGDMRSAAWIRHLFGNVNPYVWRSFNTSTDGYSVRCLKGESSVNQSPEIPSDPEPSDGADLQTTGTDISWVCTDTDGDPLTYDIYFGTLANLPLVAAGQTETTYDPGTLLNNIQYVWKIIAHDNQGNLTEGPVWSFTTESGMCGDPFVDSRDGQIYQTVQIGYQCWMAENLNFGQIIGNYNQIDNGIYEKYCYNETISNCDMYGGLYQWYEAMDYETIEGTQGICPEGWHIPTDEEWKMLEGSVDSQYGYPDPEWDLFNDRGFDAGYNLKSAYGGWTGADLFGFTALPAGGRDLDGVYGGLTEGTGFWTSSSIAEGRSLSIWFSGVGRCWDCLLLSGSSVRCLRD